MFVNLAIDLSCRSVSVSVSERSMSGSEEDLLGLPKNLTTSYCISTMQIPTAEDCSIGVS